MPAQPSSNTIEEVADMLAKEAVARSVLCKQADLSQSIQDFGSKAMSRGSEALSSMGEAASPYLDKGKEMLGSAGEWLGDPENQTAAWSLAGAGAGGLLGAGAELRKDKKDRNFLSRGLMGATAGAALGGGASLLKEHGPAAIGTAPGGGDAGDGAAGGGGELSKLTDEIQKKTTDQATAQADKTRNSRLRTGGLMAAGGATPYIGYAVNDATGQVGGAWGAGEQLQRGAKAVDSADYVFKGVKPDQKKMVENIVKKLQKNHPVPNAADVSSTMSPRLSAAVQDAVHDHSQAATASRRQMANDIASELRVKSVVDDVVGRPPATAHIRRDARRLAREITKNLPDHRIRGVDGSAIARQAAEDAVKQLKAQNPVPNEKALIDDIMKELDRRKPRGEGAAEALNRLARGADPVAARKAYQKATYFGPRKMYLGQERRLFDKMPWLRTQRPGAPNVVIPGLTNADIRQIHRAGGGGKKKLLTAVAVASVPLLIHLLGGSSAPPE